jgi:hypothetical protein
LRASLYTKAATDALLIDDGVSYQLLANMCRASFFPDVHLVLVSEITYGGENWIGSSPSQGTKRTISYRSG